MKLSELTRENAILVALVNPSRAPEITRIFPDLVTEIREGLELLLKDGCHVPDLVLGIADAFPIEAFQRYKLED
ncbi:MAG: hypothetical protein PHR36_02330 [Patescibacteria group bacterium]|nr:hypothetical protein [Patescibacteria group bacterium]